VDLAQLFITPTYARKLGSSHALGLTAVLAYQRFRAEGLAAFGPFSSAPDKLTENGHQSSFGAGARVG
jgi:long-chain fatty acid transport protein